jgi:hypothetical protein
MGTGLSKERSLDRSYSVLLEEANFKWSEDWRKAKYLNKKDSTGITLELKCKVLDAFIIEVTKEKLYLYHHFETAYLLVNSLRFVSDLYVLVLE